MESKTRGRRFTTKGKRFKRDLHVKVFSTQRVVGIWNELPEVVVEAGTKTTFG